MSLLPPPKAVIFDWDNTLVNTWPIIHQALFDTFTDMGHEPWTFEQTKARVAKSMRDSFPVIFGEGAPRASELYQKHYRENHLMKLEALPGALEVLERVQARGLCCVVVSNKKGGNLRKEVGHMGWEKYFDTIVGADDAARDKPHPDPVHMALAKSRIPPAPDVWFVGDSEVDIECAMNTGCTAILYGPDAKAHPEFTQTHYRGFPYHIHVHNHQETLALL